MGLTHPPREPGAQQNRRTNDSALSPSYAVLYLFVHVHMLIDTVLSYLTSVRVSSCVSLPHSISHEQSPFLNRTESLDLSHSGQTSNISVHAPSFKNSVPRALISTFFSIYQCVHPCLPLKKKRYRRLPPSTSSTNSLEIATVRFIVQHSWDEALPVLSNDEVGDRVSRGVL